MKNKMIYVLIAILALSCSKNEKATQKKTNFKSSASLENGWPGETFPDEFDCDTLRYERMYWYKDDTTTFLSWACFPVEADSLTYVVGWDPVSLRATRMNRQWVFPSQSGNADKILTTNGNNVYWLDKKKSENISGTTNSSGLYTFTFGNTYDFAPNVQANIINASDSQILKIGTPTTTSVTIVVRDRIDDVGSLPTWTNVNGAKVDILVTEK